MLGLDSHHMLDGSGEREATREIDRELNRRPQLTHRRLEEFIGRRARDRDMELIVRTHPDLSTKHRRLQSFQRRAQWRKGFLASVLGSVESGVALDGGSELVALF